MATIYDQIGGSKAVAAAVEEFYRRVLDDPQLAPFFDGLDLGKLKAHQEAFIAAAIGGPEPYQGREMREAHDGLGISDHDFDRVVGHLVATLTSLNVPPETIGAIGEKLSPLRAEIVTSA